MGEKYGGLWKEVSNGVVNRRIVDQEVASILISNLFMAGVPVKYNCLASIL